MFEITIQIGEKVSKTNWPQTTKETKFVQFVAFERSFKILSDFMEDKGGKELLESFHKARYLTLLLDCLYSFLEGEEAVKDIPFGSYEKHLIKMLGIKDIEEVDIETTEKNLFTLFFNIYDLVFKYKPKQYTDKDFTFTYEGVEYHVPKVYKDAMTGGLRYESIPSGQAVEALEAVRAYEANKENDEDGSIRFTTALTLIAVFARKEGDAFPTTDEGVSKYISDRIIHFQGINMETALDVEDFFFGTITNLLNATDSIFSLTRLGKAQKAKKNKKRSVKRKRRTRKSSKG